MTCISKTHTQRPVITENKQRTLRYFFTLLAKLSFRGAHSVFTAAEPARNIPRANTAHSKMGKNTGEKQAPQRPKNRGHKKRRM